MTAFATDGFAGERTIADADEAHAAAHRIAEGVAEAGGVGTDAFDRGEERVARTEADDDLAGLGRAHADETGGVVAGTDDDLALRREAVAGDEVSGDAAGHGRTGTDGRKLRGEIRSGRGERGGSPITLADVHQVHARAVTGVDGGILAGEHRGEEGRDEMYALRLGPGGGLALGETADLRTGEAHRRDRAGQVADGLVTPKGGSDFGAFGGGGRIHPDRRRATGKDRGYLNGERSRAVAVGQGGLVAGGEIDAAVLLSGDRDSVDLREVGQLGETIERELEAVEPEQRIGMHFAALPSAEESFRMSAVGEVGAERRAGAGDRRAFRRVQHERRRALRGQVKTQDDRHGLSGYSR